MKQALASFLTVLLLFCGCSNQPARNAATFDEISKMSHPATLDEDATQDERAREGIADIISADLRERKKLLKVEELFQNPELPTGCESVALTMVLRYFGFELDKTDIADDYMPYGLNLVYSYGGDPHGDYGAGIYPPGLVITAQNYLDAKNSTMYAMETSGTPLYDLYKVIDAGYPVVVWHTMYMGEPLLTDETYFENGREYSWYINEHCLTLIGYDLDAGTVTVSDPLSGIVEHDADTFEWIYDEIGQMSMVILK